MQQSSDPMNDLRFACRQLLKNPGFTAVAVLTLALGIGANTAVFAVINTYILHPVPVSDERRLLQINEIERDSRSEVSPQIYRELARQRSVFDRVVAFGSDAFEVAGGEFRDELLGCRVTPDFFGFFEIPPLLGRGFTAQDENTEDTLVLSYRLWQSRFGGEPGVIGRQVKIIDQRTKSAICTVIGVMPARFRFPSGDVLYWRPLRFSPPEQMPLPERALPNYRTCARLAPGVSRAHAQAYLDSVTGRLAKDRPETWKDVRIRTRPLSEMFVAPELRSILWSLALAIGFVLLMICANLANLQLGRVETRLREISVRLALGASRGRVLRQLLTESVLLALAGGIGGVLLAFWLRHLFQLIVPTFAPALRPPGIDGTMVAWTFGVSAACGIGFGVWPAWRATGGTWSEALKESARMASASRSQAWFRSSLVVVEMALAVMLLAGAGLMIRTCWQLLRVDPGLDPRNLAAVFLRVPWDRPRTQEQNAALASECSRLLGALPGVTAVGMYDGGGSSEHFLSENPKPVWIHRFTVATGDRDYFKAIGARLKSGRWLAAADGQEGQHGVIINEALATRCAPGDSAIGTRIYLGDPRKYPQAAERFSLVVGVVRDFDDWSLVGQPRLRLFLPAGQQGAVTMLASPTFYLRTKLDPASLLNGVRRINKAVMPGSAPPEVYWVEHELYASTATRRMCMGFLSAFAGAGLFLSLLGVFGVLNHAVIRRTKEIGIRMALGAQRRNVMATILGQGMKLAVVGMVLGLAGTWSLTRLLRGLLFAVSPTDPLTFAAMLLLFTAGSVLACWLPVRRATGIEPMEALRYE